MSDTNTIEECVEAIDDLVGALERYPPSVLAVALRTQLAGLLRILRERGDWSDSQMHDFMQELSSEVLESGAG